MAPGFLAKLVKSSSSLQSPNGHTRAPSPSPGARHQPSLSVSSAASSGRSRRNVSQASSRSALDEADSTTQGSDSPHLNVTVVPPSPRSDNLDSADVSDASSQTAASSRPLTNSVSSTVRDSAPQQPWPMPIPSPAWSVSEDADLTPTPETSMAFPHPHQAARSLSHPRSTGDLRETTAPGDVTRTQTTHPRFATEGESPRMYAAQDGSDRPRKPSKSSKLKVAVGAQSPGKAPPSTRADRSNSAPPLPSTPPHINVDDEHSMEPIVESPVGLGPGPELGLTQTMSQISNSSSIPSSSLLRADTDAASLYSVSSGTSKKRRPWRRSSGASAPAPAIPPPMPRSPQRKPTNNLASALAASGLAMVNPGMTPNGSANDRPRRPTTPQSGRVRSRRSSTSYGGDMSDRESFHSGQDGLESDDEDEGLLDELDTNDIPVTGFAVASNKRNQDFHDLFPSVPDGDYLIEDYGCALQREILIQGRIYISENHICFHANIFGWITDLTIPMYDVVSLEKRMTAFVIPNAIQVTTRSTKYTFTSFLSRDTTFDVLYNVWRLARPEDSSMNSLNPSARGSLDVPQDTTLEDVSLVPGTVAALGENGRLGLVPNKHTQCACGRQGEHYSELCMECILPGTPEKIYNLMFTSGFMKDFMRENQKLLDIQISDWMPTAESAKLLARNMSYIKPLNGSIGPKSTRCELRDETIHCDFDDYACMLTTTRTPDVPSGSVFQVKTRTCIMWASSVSSKVIVTTQVEWTGRSFIKGIIEKSCLDGQRTYHVDLEKAMREYIHEHQSEFIPEGVDAAIVEETEAAVAESPKTPAQERPWMSSEERRKSREHERGQRSLQWAYDTFEGTAKVAKQSTEGALELIRDAWEQSSSTTILYFLVVILVISNIWTLLMVGRREEVGRRKEINKTGEREKWVQGVVQALWEELLASRNIPGLPPPAPVARTVTDWREEVAEINTVLDSIEERVRNVRSSLEELD
ncbi:hypothetical protein CERSUDRAFT_118693 [Gelatoporia subvermispora B]|uniref:VASt domain-containing protein n=1 Tax=Ceriporiopsis subvermispora (strain B) TaxID=914234 RepID=M2R350_CERS8|nr:hypothetical protein CERSUDRAFT_118693 [Gelatoporia subvermispora B]